MLSSTGKRRPSKQTAADKLDSSPASPQFGGDEDGGTGGGGGTGEPPDGDGESTNIKSSQSSATGGNREKSPNAFEERVKSVRSRIREMVAVAGEESSDGDMFDSVSAPSTAARGSKLARRKSTVSASSSVPDETAAAPQKQKPPVRRHSQPVLPSKIPICLEEAPQPVVSVGAGRPSFDGGSAATTPRGQGPAGRVSAAKEAARQRNSEGGDQVAPAQQVEASAVCQQLVGRDGAAYVGARVRILDPQIARYVEPFGTVVEVRCNGERVRVEHDGDDKAQRYYNTGKNGELQLLFESAAGVPATAAPVAKKSSASSSSSGGPARKPTSERLSAAPPVIIDSSDSSSEESPRESIAAPPPPPKPVAKKVAAKKVAARRPSKEVAKPAVERAFSEPPEIAPDTQPEMPEPKVATKKSRYSQLKQARQSSSTSATPRESATGSLSAAPETAAAAALEASVDPEGSTSPRSLSYSQRRSLRMSQAQVSTSDATETPSAAANHIGDAATQRVQEEDNTALARGAGSSLIHSSKAASEAKVAPADADRSSIEQSARLEELSKEHELLLSRLRNLEQTFVKDLGAVSDEVHLQIETSEKRIIARVFEEMDSRMLKTLGVAKAKVANMAASMQPGNKWSMDKDAVSKVLGTPLNDEPEQEYSCDMSDYSQTPGKGSELWTSPSVCGNSPINPLQKDQISLEVSSAELADNRQRLQNIGIAARRITSGLGGTVEAEPPVRQAPVPTDSHVPVRRPSQLAHDGLQTPDFASAPIFAESPLMMASTAPASTLADDPDGLDAEMERLAGLRRFAQNVLQAAEGQCSQASSSSGATAKPSWNDVGHGGFVESRQTDLRGMANHHEQAPPFDSGCNIPRGRSSGSGGPRRSVSVPGHRPGPFQNTHGQAPPPPWEDNAPSFGSRGLELPAQPPPQPPPMQASQQHPSAMRDAGQRLRRPSGQPLQVPWPAREGSGDWDCEVENQGRLVF